MILAVDIGNTNIVVGVLDKTKIINSGRLGTDRNKTDIDFLIQLKLMMSIYNVNVNDLDGGILSSVVPEITHQIAHAMEMLLNKKIIIVGAGVKTGLNIKIDNPQTLGSDRVADAVGAIEEYKCPLIIVDMGTATTISVIDKDKTHIGGMIIPGIKTSLNALSSHASQLPYISIEAPKKVIGKNTVDCMKSGLVLGAASMVDGLVSKIKNEIGIDDVTIIATGGLSKLIIPYCNTHITYEENLLLKGLYYIFNKNQN